MGKQKQYDGKKRSKDKNKIDVNKTLSSFIDTNRSKHKAIILDSEELLTTKMLVKSGFKKSNIFIPNPFVFKEIKRKHQNTYNCLLSVALDDKLDNIEEEISFAFFDFCSSLDGNDTTKIYPRKDIKSYFDKHLARDNSIFAVTISLRNRFSKNNGVCSDLNVLDSVITRNAYKNGYVAIKTPNGYGYNGMAWVIYVIKKVKR